MPLDLKVGDQIETKKSHPCGSKTFEVKRTGIDFVREAYKENYAKW
jgi:hypothetical protein